MKKLGYHVTYFDFDTQDYLHTTPETNQISKDVVHSILDGANPSKTKPAPVSLLAIAHDIHQQTVHNLTTYMFDQMVQYGFTGTLLSLPWYAWGRGRRRVLNMGKQVSRQESA